MQKQLIQKTGAREVVLFLRLNLTMWFLHLWNWFGRGIWGCLEMWARESPECCKQGCISDSGGSSEDQNANRNVESEYQTHEVSEGNKDS
jgi:hypothetical protein